MNKIEQYMPTKEDLDLANSMMTAKQSKLSAEREATFTAGTGKPSENAEDMERKAEFPYIGKSIYETRGKIIEVMSDIEEEDPCLAWILQGVLEFIDKTQNGRKEIDHDVWNISSKISWDEEVNKYVPKTQRIMDAVFRGLGSVEVDKSKIRFPKGNMILLTFKYTPKSKE